MISEQYALLFCILSAMAALIVAYLYIKSNLSEALLIKRARDKGMPIGRIHWGNFRETHEALEKDDDEELGFSKGGRFFKLDIRRYSKGESSWYDGVEWIDYWTDALLPIGGMNSRSIFQSIDVIMDKAKYPLLSAMDIKNSITLVYKNEDDLATDIKNYVDAKAGDVEVQKTALMAEIDAVKKVLRELPLYAGVFTYPTAMQAVNNRLGNKAKDELEIAIMKKMIDQAAAKERLQTLGLMIMGVIGVTAVAIYVIHMALG